MLLYNPRGRSFLFRATSKQTRLALDTGMFAMVCVFTRFLRHIEFSFVASSGTYEVPQPRRSPVKHNVLQRNRSLNRSTEYYEKQVSTRSSGTLGL